VIEKLSLPRGVSGAVWPHQNVGARHPVHRHAELELNLVTHGRARYLLGDRRYDLERGSLVWLFPAQEHVLVDSSADYRMWIAVFKPGLVRQVATSGDAQTLRRMQPSGWFCKQLGIERSTAIGRLCAELFEFSGKVNQLAAGNAGLAYLLLCAWSAFIEAPDSRGRALHPAVERAAALIVNATEPIGLDELGHRAGLSASRLSRLFKRQTGVPLVRFRQQQQLERFIRLYKPGGPTTMIDAAFRAGFGSYPQFHRVFKSRMGEGPGAFYRERG
jgi:AraC-like DNA-binding protein